MNAVPILSMRRPVPALQVLVANASPVASGSLVLGRLSLGVLLRRKILLG